MKRILISAIVFSIFFVTTSFAYEVVDVKNGGGIKGKIKASAKAESPVQKIDKDTDFCGTGQPSRMYELSSSLEVKNVLVIVEGVQKGKAAPKADLAIDNKKCIFEPLVGVAYKGSNFVIKNSDPIFHNTNLGLQLKDKRRTVYSLALPKQNQVITKSVKTTGLHQVKCDAHSWMRAFIYAADHPYVAMTDASGNFEIKDLPAGKYTVRIWHEGFEEVTKEIDVAAGKSTDLNVTMSKK